MIVISTDELDDLIRRTGQGDREALGLLYSELKDSVFGLALMYTKSYSDSDDIVHDTFISVWNSAGRYRAGSPKAWVMKIARNASLTYIKKQNRITELDENIPEGDFSERTGDSVMLKSMLNHLNEKEREIVMMRAHGYTFEEISKITGIITGTAKWKYSAAIKKLSKLAGGEC